MNVKTLFLTAAVALGSLVATPAWAEKVKGNGEVVTREVQVDAFRSVVLGSGIECSSRFFSQSSYKNPVFNYTQTSGNASLQITMDENLFEYLDVSSSGGELTIRTKRGNSINPSRMEIKGSSPSLEKVQVSGCIDFTLASDFTSDLLDISISGASDVKLSRQASIGEFKIRISGAGDLVADNLTTQMLETTVSGAGDITLSGQSDKAKISVSGAGDVKAFDFVIKEAECRVSGSGDVKVNATVALDARVSGVGDIQYKGNAKASTHVSGFGDIKKVD